MAARIGKDDFEDKISVYKVGLFVYQMYVVRKNKNS